MKKILLIALFVSFSITTTIHAACTGGGTSCTKVGTVYTCTDASYGCINDAVTAATAGDTINVTDTDSKTWTSTCTVGKNISIIGTATPLRGDLVSGFFNITGFEASTLVRISGFAFTLTGSNIGIQVDTMTGNNIRIDNNTFTGGTTTASQIHFATQTGLIDNNVFYNGGNAIDYSSGGSSSTGGNASWSSLAAGTVNALYVENNQFTDNASLSWEPNERIMTYNGGKLVTRYNTFNSTLVDSDYTIIPIMTHGSAGGYWQTEAGGNIRRGQSVVEIYNNLMAGAKYAQPITLRGSANLVYNNTITKTSGGIVIYLREEEYDGGQWSPARTEWPAEDQVHNSFFWNNTADGTLINSAPSTYFVIAPQTSDCTGSGSPSGCCTGNNAGCGDAVIKLNRDYFLQKPCASTDENDGTAEANTCNHGKETFTGLNGGSASNPTDGDPHATLGNMVWTNTGDNAYYSYTSYTCPHPLTGMTGTCNSSGTSGATDYADNLLTVTIDGTGTGTVTDNVASLSETSTFTHYFGGQTVTLTASPLGGSTFAGWAGEGCSGVGTCEVVVDSAHTVTATFNVSGGGSAGAAAVGTTGSMVMGSGGSITIVP